MNYLILTKQITKVNKNIDNITLVNYNTTIVNTRKEKKFMDKEKMIMIENTITDHKKLSETEKLNWQFIVYHFDFI